jgi:hypothetical protein
VLFDDHGYRDLLLPPALDRRLLRAVAESKSGERR